MGLTTSCEAIERQASPVANDPDPVAPDARRAKPPSATTSPRLNVVTRVVHEDAASGKAPASSKSRKRNSEGAEPPKKRAPKPKSAKSPGKATPAPKKKTPAKKKVVVAKVPAVTVNGAGEALLPPPQLEEPRPPPVNSHRARVLVGRAALAAIKEGTRIYIKSGEGNGGDTWWDSGIIRKIHERGKPYEVDWQRINNRGEEVDTGVEKRIILPVTYSLAGAAAEAVLAAVPGTEAAAMARKSVLAQARIGSWCIHHPEEPWGRLDPFGEDSSAIYDRTKSQI